jgi:hypothetical protein
MYDILIKFCIQNPLDKITLCVCQRNDKTLTDRRTAAEFPSRYLYAMWKPTTPFFDVDDLLGSFFMVIGLPKKSTGG